MAQTAIHQFVFNPEAGKKSALPGLQEKLSGLKVDYHLYETRSAGDALRYTQKLIEAHPKIPFRFYACGGDGTLAEVAQAVYGSSCSAGIWPCGSGNDYVKYYGGEKRFLDLEAQVKAPLVYVDLLHVNDRLGINVLNLGFEAEAADAMQAYRRLPLLGGSRAYAMGILKALVKGMRTRACLKFDELDLGYQEFLLMSLASGGYIGGGYHCAPRADNADGLMEFCLIKPISRLKLLSLLKLYRLGRHLDEPKLNQIVRYHRAENFTITSKTELTLCLDGEILRGSHFDIRVLPRALPFILPKAPKA